MNARNVSITLIGPGAAGKTTIGLLIAKQLSIPFIDLDQHFKVRSGDIGEYIDLFGYGRKIKTMRPFSAVGDELLVALEGAERDGRRWEITEIARRLEPQRQRR